MKRIDAKMSRRTMLARSGGAVVVAAAVGRCAELFAAPQSRWFKIGAIDGSLGNRANPAAFDVAKEIGLDGVQVDMGSSAADMGLVRGEVQKAYLDAARRTGLEIASLFISEMNFVPLKSDPRAAKWLSDGIDVCRKLGLKVIMLPCFSAGDLSMDRRDEIDHVVRVLKDFAPKAEKHGVLVALENFLSAEENMRIIDRVGSPNVKVCYDVGNSTYKGRDAIKEIRTLGTLICELHAKDGPHMLGQGRIDYKEVRKALDDIQYSGWIQIEAAMPHGVVADYTVNRKYLKAIFPSKV